eukprot:340544-Hanusia_phi.AAC.1
MTTCQTFPAPLPLISSSSSVAQVPSRLFLESLFCPAALLTTFPARLSNDCRLLHLSLTCRRAGHVTRCLAQLALSYEVAEAEGAEGLVRGRLDGGRGQDDLREVRGGEGRGGEEEEGGRERVGGEEEEGGRDEEEGRK